MINARSESDREFMKSSLAYHRKFVNTCLVKDQYFVPRKILSIEAGGGAFLTVNQSLLEGRKQFVPADAGGVDSHRLPRLNLQRIIAADFQAL